MGNDPSNPLGFEYLNDEKPKARKNMPIQANIQVKTKSTVTTPEEPKPSFFGRLQKVFRKPKPEPVVVPEAPKVQYKEEVVVEEEEPKTVKWRVPSGTKSVKVRILEPNGRLINEYNISGYISLKPGQILQVVAE